MPRWRPARTGRTLRSNSNHAEGRSKGYDLVPARTCMLVALWLTTSAVVLLGHNAAVRPAAQEATAGRDRQEPRPNLKGRPSHPGNLLGHGGPVKAVQVDPASGRILTGSFDYAMMVWNGAGENAQLLHRLTDHDGAVNAVAFLPGGKRVIAAGDDGNVGLWDLGEAKLIHRFKGHTGKIVAVAISPDGRRIATASWDRTARLWDVDRLADGPVFAGHEGPVNAVAFSGDGATLYTASADGTIGRWSTADGSFQRPVHKHGWGINVMERLPRSERLAFGALNGSVAVIDGSTGELSTELQSQGRPVLALAQFDDPGLLATGSGDGVIRVFRISGWSLLHEYRNPFGPVWALAFTGNGNALYYGGLDDSVTLWTFSPREPYEQVDSPFPRRFQLADASNDPIAQGEMQFARKCSICHTLRPDGANRAGPTLYHVFGRRVGSVPGYPYSEALKGLDIVWTEETIAKLFELGPDHYTPGSKMPLQKITDAAQRDALVAYLKIATSGEGTDDAALDAQSRSRTEPTAKGEKR